jgi:hypothetical protein
MCTHCQGCRQGCPTNDPGYLPDTAPIPQLGAQSDANHCTRCKLSLHAQLFDSTNASLVRFEELFATTKCSNKRTLLMLLMHCMLHEHKVEIAGALQRPERRQRPVCARACACRRTVAQANRAQNHAAGPHTLRIQASVAIHARQRSLIFMTLATGQCNREVGLN